MLDGSKPADYETLVTEKRVSSGKTKTYYVKLEPWGTLTDVEEVKVTPEEYAAIEKGDLITIQQHAGSLKIPWVEIVAFQQ